MKFYELMAFHDYKMSNIARVYNVSREAVRKWKEKDKIPYKFQCMAEVESKGQLKANRED
ncbi:MAG TPA: phage terminase small subunit-related protein [Gammaproteobacteria bacterium]|jgi:predicted DNA-binding protein YlxM (UPF0122 family)|nr:phage terminase small subunit-related protein [Gammaproteobacteria bacterium]